MEAVKLLICREWRQVQAFPRFWLAALGLSLLLATATPTKSAASQRRSRLFSRNVPVISEHHPLM